MDTLLHDVRFGFRQLRKSPAFTVAAMLTLALGIGANATIFTWVNAVLLNPVPGVDSRDIVSIRWRTAEGNQRGLSWLDYRDFCKRNHTLQSFAAATITPLSLGEGSQPERVWGMLASANYFEMLGVRPVLGRTFVPEEDENPGGHAVAVLSHHLWQTKFGGDAGIIGRQILLNKHNFTVVGIAPEPFIGSVLGLRFELWIPATMAGAIGGADLLTQRDTRWLQSQAHLKPGVDRRTAMADLTGISSQLRHEFSQTDRFDRAEAVPLWREGGGEVLAPVMMLLMGVVGVVLLIACANVANLLLARGMRRRREIAIRLALGARPSRVIRQLLIENGMLALGGLVAALIALPTTMNSLQGFVPSSDLPVGLAIKSGASVLWFTISVSALATLMFGLIPAIRASRPDVVRAIKDDSAASGSRRGAWLRNSLVIAQVSLSLVLLVSAGLFLKALHRATSADPGFDPRNVLVAGVDLIPNGYDETRGRIALRQMTEKLIAIPGVTAVSTVRSVPLGLGESNSARFQADGYVPVKNEEMVASTNVIGPDYFHAMNTGIVAGREFTPADTGVAQQVIVVNQTFANHYLPKGDSIGRKVRIYGEQRMVAGVVRTSKYSTLDEKPEPFVFLPVAQSFASESNFLVRTLGDPLAYRRAVEDAIHSIDPVLPVYGVRSLETAISASYFGQRMGGAVLGFFGAVALVLAAVGLYGVLAYAVTQRSREVGIRMALGASRSDVLRLILNQGLGLAGIGLVTGLMIALGVTRLMRSLLLDVSPTDPPTILGVSSMLALVALLASLIPALRATRIDPILSIRHD